MKRKKERKHPRTHISFQMISKMQLISYVFGCVFPASNTYLLASVSWMHLNDHSPSCWRKIITSSSIRFPEGKPTKIYWLIMLKVLIMNLWYFTSFFTLDAVSIWFSITSYSVCCVLVQFKLKCTWERNCR